jgi:hypothetical protein
MSTPDDGTRTAPDGGRHPGEQPTGQPGYGPPGSGSPAWDPARYPQPQYAHPRYQQPPHGQEYGQQQWGQPGYGQPPYGQAPYGQAPYGPGYGAAYGRPTNSLAILSLVLAFVFAPAGLITGIIARRQIRRTQEDGDGLALAGIIVGGIVTAFFVLLIVFWILAFAAITNDGFAP